ncbi:putative purine-cytosine permease fcy22 protein [Neofusicoccum parvum UCRNP2]|uniref:Putative purine-cytosine permease fcy22 protein n=1 Tax=Botryosphaeria parva (strain UCR-NP2) TaxID=1287680 RepID=R1EHG0_BOTPV|nr:putative purine-cytosine permease fcy22 protein [Neofusicoccum parvum UCRNP2]
MPEENAGIRAMDDPELAMGPGVEKSGSICEVKQVKDDDASSSSTTKLLRRLTSWGVEVRGIAPVPEKDQTKTQYHNIFFVWMSMLTNLLPIITGMVGTLSYGLSLRDASLTIVFFSLLCYVPTAYMNRIGPQSGMRQMVQARYSFGLYPVTIVVLLNMMTVVGFTIIAGIVAGQTLSAVSDGKMSVAVGIVLTFLVGLFVSFCGYKIIHIYNRWSWIGVLVCFIITTGCGGKHLSEQAAAEPAGAPLVLSFGCLIAGFSIAFAGVMSDYAVYFKPTAPVARMFFYVYLGQTLPTILLMILGAAIGGAVPNVPAWNEGYELFSTGGVLEAMLRPAGGFGKFIAVLLAFSLIGNVGASMYTVTLNWQILIPWFVRLPRIVFSVVTTAVMIPVAITAADNFFYSLENFLGIVSYWPAAFAAIVIIEHVYFRKSDSNTYDRAIWKDVRKLPSGIAAIAAGIGSFALVIPCMAATWYTGPIAEHTGDIGFEVAFALAGLLYVPLRTLEIRLQGRL